jgi:hypothetical protein
LRPIAARLAQTFRKSLANGCAAPRTLAAKSDSNRRNRSWTREHSGQRDEAWFKREVAPRLDAFTLNEIAAATGLSLAACSQFRSGARVPNPRHWEALIARVGT